MSDRFLSEIRITGFGYAPQGWALANGQVMPINQNQGLFSLLGTTYGGNGQTTFALPDLRSKAQIHMDSNSHHLGETGGQQAHTITASELPMHVHFVQASQTTGTLQTPAGNVLANSTPNTIYGPTQNLGAMNPTTVSSVGGSQAHLNMQPYLILSFMVCLQGIFPSPN